jgi:hypothetical protein
MAHTSATILEARRAVLTMATASTVASATVIAGMMALIDGGAATSKSYSSYWTAVTLKESGKHVPIKRVVHARSDELAPTHSTTAPARPQIPSEFYAVSCGKKVPPAGLVCPAEWRLFLVGLPAFELDLSSAMGRGHINQQLGG